MKQGTLEQLDTYFEGKKQSEVSMIIFFAFVAVALIVYYLAFDPAESYLAKSKSQNAKITSLLTKEVNYIKKQSRGNDHRYTIKLKMKEKTSKNNQLNGTRQANAYISKKLREVSYLLFDNKNWATFLDSISSTGAKYNVAINEITSKINKPNSKKIEQVLNVDVDLNGRYHDIMKFINAIEENIMIVDVFDIKLTSSQDINGSLSIAVWGMKN